MLLLLDMNLPPSLASTLRDAGHQVFHWSEVGAHSAPDSEVLARARTRNAIPLTHDLDFGAILAASKAHGPSVVQVRTQDVLGHPFRLMIGAILRKYETQLASGVLISVDPNRARVRLLPLR